MAENKKSNQADAYMESMKAYQKTYDFLLYLYPILSQFPKFEKFALQSQIKTAVFEMLKSVIRFRKYHAVSGKEIDMPVTGLSSTKTIKVAV